MDKAARDLRDTIDPSLFSTLFFIGAPPRSGNTYLRYVIKDSYKNPFMDTASLLKHDHSSAYAVNQITDTTNIAPIFVSPIRDPYDTLKSKLVRTFYEWSTPPDVVEYVTSLDDLCFYWEVLLADHSKFCLVDFKELIENKDSIIGKINNKYPELNVYKNSMPMTNKEILTEMQAEDDEKYGSDRNQYLSYAHTPRDQSDYSNVAEKLLASPAYTRRLKYLYELYEELLKLTI